MTNQDYSKVRPDAEIFEIRRQNAHYGLEFICPNCGCTKYLLGNEAKDYLDKKMSDSQVRCGNCWKRRLKLLGRMQNKRAVHLNNIKSRKTEISDKGGAVNL